MSGDCRDNLERAPASADKWSVGEHSGPSDGRWAAFLRGCRSGLPIFLGYAPVGMAFGILARELGFTVIEATACSATALAGAGQFIALSVLRSGADAAAALLATAVVNLRYVLFATTLAPRLTGVRPAVLSWLGFTLTDETFAVNVTELREGIARPATMAGVGAIAWTGWVAGTLVGSAAAGLIGDASRFGVDFAMPAMFSALFVALSEDRRHVAVGTGAGIVALLLPLVGLLGVNLPPSWFVIIASMTAATVATVVFDE